MVQSLILLLVDSIVVKCLDELGQDASLVKEALDAHLDGELVAGFEADSDSLDDSVVDYLRHLIIRFVKMHHVGTINDIKLALLLLPCLVSLLNIQRLRRVVTLSADH